MKCALDFVANEKSYPYKGVKTRSGKDLKWGEWADLIKANFEKEYYIDSKAGERNKYA